MTVDAVDAAKYLCKRSDWNYTNLELQKVVYLAHMVHLGEHGRPLVRGRFEAWKYGPVHTDLYHALKGWGYLPIAEDARPFRYARPIRSGTSERRTLNRAAKAFPPSADLPSRLIAITHWDQGAWFKTTDGREEERGAVIDRKSIIKEYEARMDDLRERKRRKKK